MKFSIWNAFEEAKKLGQSSFNAATEYLGAGVGFLSDSIGGLWLFGSTERVSDASEQQVDEKHYFLVPYRISSVGYSIYSMRCLPNGVPPINDLPKQRMFHLPHATAIATVEQMWKDEARKKVIGSSDGSGLGGKLNDLADQIDRVDHKVFNGILLIGGLVALVNPLVGAAIAAKALIPSAGMMLSKFGLRSASESLNDRNVKKQVEKAEKDVLQQFKSSDAQSLVNPILAQLDRALETTESEFDPLLEVDFDTIEFGERDRLRMLQLTFRSVSNVYEDVLNDEKQWAAAKLGPEDVRWLQTMKEIVNETK